MNNLEIEASNLELIFNASPISMFVLNEYSQLEKINDAALEFVDCNREETLGKHYCNVVYCMGDIEDDRGCGLGLRCQVCELRLAINSAFVTGQATVHFEFNNILIREEKEREFWFRSSITPIMVEGKCKVVLALVDITKQKQAEIALCANEESDRLLYKKYHALVMNMPNCLAYNKIIYDGAGTPIDYKIIEVNKAYENTFNISQEDIVGKRYSELFSSVDPETYERRMADYREVALNGRSKVLPLIYFERFKRWVSIGLYSPEPGYFVSIYSDMTERKLVENELKHAKKEAEDANRVQCRFLENMSHEVRNSINGIVGMIDLTILTDLSIEQKENLKVIKKSADSLLKIINELQDFTKIESGNLVINKIGFNVRKLVEELIDESAPLAIKKGLKLNYVISSFIPRVVIGAPNQLKQVLGNLLDNALKFTENGQVTLSVTRMTKLKEMVELKFSVTDSGIGISKEEQSKLFRPFSQAKGSISKNYEGIGLGLVITRKLVQNMGGTIWVESEKGSGSSFQFTLNFMSQLESNKNYHPDALLTLTMKSLQILVVEDDPVNLTVLTRMLKGKGHTIDTAANGSEALVLHGRKPYDVIFMDIQMPIMDGIEATVLIREKEGLVRHTPIIALTAHALQRDREKLLSYGMDEYISKPIKIEELFLKLEQVST